MQGSIANEAPTKQATMKDFHAPVAPSTPAPQMPSPEPTPEPNPPAVRPRIPAAARRYSSKLDATYGALRTTSDGNLLDEDTGDWLILDTPPHSQEDRDIAAQKDKNQKNTPAISLPEAKNGATGLDNPRARKPLVRLLWNKLTGSDRAPQEEAEDVGVVAKRRLRDEMVEVRKVEGKMDMRVLVGIQKHYASDVEQSLGGDWFEHALVDQEFWLQVLDRALKMNVR
jgi:hypothetical protein